MNLKNLKKLSLAVGVSGIFLLSSGANAANPIIKAICEAAEKFAARGAPVEAIKSFEASLEGLIKAVDADEGLDVLVKRMAGDTSEEANLIRTLHAGGVSGVSKQITDSASAARALEAIQSQLIKQSKEIAEKKGVIFTNIPVPGTMFKNMTVALNKPTAKALREATGKKTTDEALAVFVSSVTQGGKSAGNMNVSPHQIAAVMAREEGSAKLTKIFSPWMTGQEGSEVNAAMKELMAAAIKFSGPAKSVGELADNPPVNVIADVAQSIVAGKKGTEQVEALKTIRSFTDVVNKAGDPTEAKKLAAEVRTMDRAELNEIFGDDLAKKIVANCSDCSPEDAKNIAILVGLMRTAGNNRNAKSIIKQLRELDCFKVMSRTIT